MTRQEIYAAVSRLVEAARQVERAQAEFQQCQDEVFGGLHLAFPLPTKEK